MMSMVSIPNRWTMARANRGPMPLTSPLPRYFSMPYTVAGIVSSHVAATNWLP